MPDYPHGEPASPDALLGLLTALRAEARQQAWAARDHRAAVEAAFPGLLAELAPPPPVRGLEKVGPLRN